jgi:hypothetical protein
MSDTNKLREALERLLREVEAAGLGHANDFGWPEALRAAREALSVPEEAPQSKPERSEEFEDLLVAAEAHLAVHPCTPKPCQPELSLKAALDAFGVRQMPATVKCPKCGNLRLRAGGACGPCSENAWFERHGSPKDTDRLMEHFKATAPINSDAVPDEAKRLFCTKCGYRGPDRRHPCCNYAAMDVWAEPSVFTPVPEEAGPERIEGAVGAGPALAPPPPTNGPTPAPWTIGGGNDEDDYPTISVWGQPKIRTFHVYSLYAGQTVAYVPIREGDEARAWADARIIAAAFRSPVPEPARMSREEAEIRGAEAILRNDGFDPKLHPPMGSERGGMALMRARAVLTALGFPGEDGKR